MQSENTEVIGTPVLTVEPAADPKPAVRRKPKPYEVLKQYQAKDRVAKDEKTAVKKVAKPAKKVAAKVAKPIAKKAVKPAAKSSTKSGTCSFCGKPLSRHTSVENGMGDTCAAKKKLLGGKSLEEHYESLAVTAVPAGYIKLTEAVKKVRAGGKVSAHRFVQATGGDRCLRPALNKHFNVVMFKGARYVNGESLKNLAELVKK